MENEGESMRSNLAEMGIPTPELIEISELHLVEEFVEGGDLYRLLASAGAPQLVFSAGTLTGKMHRAGHAFVDNKAQNYLVKDGEVIRTDLGFTKKTGSQFARAMDIGSFLASVMDLKIYSEIEASFYDGYFLETGMKFSYLAIIIRNLLSLGFSSNSVVTLQNMSRDSRPLIES